MRFLFQYKPAGTRSFRLSSSKLFNFGGNSQNNDKESMDIFEAPPGWCFVQRDQAGAEALYVAYDAKPGRYRALFENGVKAHTYVALHLFIDKFRGQHSRDRYWCKTAPELKELEEWAQISKAIAKSKFEYDIGKKTGHASNYKMGPVTFRDSVLKESEGTMVLTMEQARFYLETYKELFPEIVVWQIEIEDTIRRTRLLRNAFGYPRRFERIITDSYLREGISWKPQSTIGVITHKAFVATRNHIVKYGLRWRPISNKHDSYALMIPEPDVEQAREIMMRDINQTITCAHGSFTMKSDFQVGYNLRKYHELHNPRGMREL